MAVVVKGVPTVPTLPVPEAMSTSDPRATAVPPTPVELTMLPEPREVTVTVPAFPADTVPLNVILVELPTGV